MQFYEWFFLETGRTPEGLFSFWHIFSVTVALAIFFFLAIFLAKRFKDNPKRQNITLLISGIAIIAVQVAKIAFLAATSTDTFWNVLIGNAPLYLCDMMIFLVLICALVRGRVKDVLYDFIAIWGLLMGTMGTYTAGNIYGSHCVISWSAINSLLNHCLSAFASLFIWVSRLNKMEKRNIPFTIGVLVVYMTVALVIDYVDNHNFMFFFHGDGTPFTLFYDLVQGNKVLYQIEIYILQCGYMGLFYVVYYWIVKLIAKNKEKKLTVQEEPQVEKTGITVEDDTQVDELEEKMEKVEETIQ